MHYFSLFDTKFYKLCVNFSLFWTKNTNFLEIFEKIVKFFNENSIEKIVFLNYFLVKLGLKIEPSEITSFFYNNFFNFWWDVPGVPPGNATVAYSKISTLIRIDHTKLILISLIQGKEVWRWNRLLLSIYWWQVEYQLRSH